MAMSALDSWLRNNSKWKSFQQDVRPRLEDLRKQVLGLNVWVINDFMTRHFYTLDNNFFEHDPNDHVGISVTADEYVGGTEALAKYMSLISEWSLNNQELVLPKSLVVDSSSLSQHLAKVNIKSRLAIGSGEMTEDNINIGCLMSDEYSGAALEFFGDMTLENMAMRSDIDMYKFVLVSAYKYFRSHANETIVIIDRILAKS